jgi:anti-sigma factor ChrR (cupin superfamily)
MTSRLVLRGVFDDFVPEEYGKFVPLHPGVEILPLYGMTAEGQPLSPHQPSAAILRYAPGASVPRHGHPGFEHIIVLRGSQSDALGTYPKGTCVVNPPGSSHWVNSEEGCLVLAIWDRPVELLAD